MMPLWYLLLAMVVSMGLVAGLALWAADRSARQSERRWCGLVATLDDTYRSTPPSTPSGRQVADQIHQLRAEFGCPPSNRS
jgi:hypothetical protein